MDLCTQLKYFQGGLNYLLLDELKRTEAHATGRSYGTEQNRIIQKRAERNRTEQNRRMCECLCERRKLTVPAEQIQEYIGPENSQ